MTLIAGYIYKNSVGIISDTAVTDIYEIGDNADDNTFGVLNDGTNLIKESAHKIINIQDKILITGS